jgi:hypothetical protein
MHSCRSIFSFCNEMSLYFISRIGIIQNFKFNLNSNEFAIYKRGRGTATTPKNLSNAMVLHTTLAKLDIRPIVNLCNGM